ncbi:MAG: sugar ABC transporter permease [Alkalibacterium sp.]|uniref:carbohydrate ABC transporter permease n=1 Tax=Alkalibacterium sp. TaxID=1872447 RepID=UPI0039708990
MKANSKKPRVSKSRLVEWFQAYTFLAPALLVALVFFVFSIVFSIYLSFNNVNLFANTYSFIGIENYARMFSDGRAVIALRNTATFAAVVVPAQTIAALLVAYVLASDKLKGKKMFRLIYFLPTLTSSSALTLIFMFIFNVYGPVNELLLNVGLLSEPINFLQNPEYSLKVIMVMNVWSTVPMFMTIYLASLVDLPKSLYEAADIDGASSWNKLIYITVPYLRPITTYVVLMGIIGTFQLFDQAYIFSNGSGGPANSTLTVALMIYQYAFGQMNSMGYASALAITLAAIIFVVSMIAEKVNNRMG